MAAIVGLDWPAAIALIPARADRDRVERLLKDYELGLVAGATKSAKDAADRADAERKKDQGG